MCCHHHPTNLVSWAEDRIISAVAGAEANVKLLGWLADYLVTGPKDKSKWKGKTCSAIEAAHDQMFAYTQIDDQGVRLVIRNRNTQREIQIRLGTSGDLHGSVLRPQLEALTLIEKEYWVECQNKLARYKELERDICALADIHLSTD